VICIIYKSQLLEMLWYASADSHIWYAFLPGAWTASVQNSMQYLAVDLGSTHIVTRVYTQGRQGSDEYVTEFTIEFSMDNKTWEEYTNEFGLTEVSWLN
jgi:hypothetical protein